MTIASVFFLVEILPEDPGDLLAVIILTIGVLLDVSFLFLGFGFALGEL